MERLSIADTKSKSKYCFFRLQIFEITPLSMDTGEYLEYSRCDAHRLAYDVSDILELAFMSMIFS